MSHESTMTSLRQNLLDKSSSVRRAAVYILGQIGTDEAINALLPALDDQEWLVRFDAVHWLAEIASKTSNKMVFHHLLTYLDDENAHVAGHTASVLAQKCIPELLTNLTELLLKLENRSYANRSPNILEVISSIQKRCEFYNYQIFNSPPPEEENQSNPLLNTVIINTPQVIMSETSKYDFRGSNIGNFAETVESGGRQQAIQHNYAPEQKQNLAEAAKEIQAVIEQLSLTYPTVTEEQKQTVVHQAITQIKRVKPNTWKRLLSAGQAGLIEVLKEVLDNRFVNITVATIEGYRNAE